jgi:hypothetical protein
MVTRIVLSLLLPVWMFGWATAIQAIASWETRMSDKWWVFPACLVAGVFGVTMMIGGIVFVVHLWLNEFR